MIAKLNATYSKSTTRELMLRRAILSRLDGGGSQSVAVEFLDGHDQRVTKQLDKGKPAAR